MSSSWVLNEEYIDPTQLTAAIRTALSDLQINQYTLSRWLPNVAHDDITYEYMTGGGGLADAAVYRAWDTESRIARRQGLSQVMGELPPISEKIPLNEYDKLKLRKLPTGDAMVPFLMRDAKQLAMNIGARLEIARGSALVNATVPISENGLFLPPLDFQRSVSHSVTAAILWSAHSTATPITDLESWVQTYIDTNGAPPAVILMPRAVLAHLRLCTQMVNQVFPLATSAPMVSVEQVNAVLDGMSLPPIELYDAQVKVEGANQRIIPADSIVLLPPAGSPDASAETDLGATLLGTTAESLEPDYALPEGSQPGIVAATYKTRDPIRLWTHAAAIGVPIVKEPNLTFKAVVL